MQSRMEMYQQKTICSERAESVTSTALTPNASEKKRVVRPWDFKVISQKRVLC